MSNQKRKFELFARLSALGFTYDESVALRRIEMTLQRWAERECGDGSDWAIERDETTGKPFNVYHGEGKSRRYPIADREAGALRRLRFIVNARNARAYVDGQCVNPLTAYHQGDCRGAMLYLITASDYPADVVSAWKSEHAGANMAAFPFPNLDSLYSRGLAVCA